MAVRPLGNNVIVRRSEVLKKAGCLFIPETAQEKSQECVVIASGPGKLLKNGEIHPTSLSEGDRVFLRRAVGIEFFVGNEKFVIVSADDILGVIEDD